MKILDKIRLYHTLSQKMHELEDYAAGDGLMMEVVQIEEDLLTFFGLPNVYMYSELFQQFGWRPEVSDADIEEFTVNLCDTSTQYLSSKPKTNAELLQDGKRRMLTVQDVLAMMHLSCNPYQTYLYEKEWMRDHLSAEVMLEEVFAAQKLPVSWFMEWEAYGFRSDQAAHTAQLRYIDQFVEARRQIRKDQAFCALIAHIDFDEGFDYPTSLLLSHFFIREFTLLSGDRYALCILGLVGAEWYRLMLYTSDDMFLKLLACCSDYDLSAMLRAHLKMLAEGYPTVSRYIDIFRIYGNMLSCESPILIRSVREEDEEEDRDISFRYAYYLDDVSL